MRRIRMTVAYDGTNYCGWQIQPNGVTIEEVLNEKLGKLTGEEIPGFMPWEMWRCSIRILRFRRSVWHMP